MTIRESIRTWLLATDEEPLHVGRGYSPTDLIELDKPRARIDKHGALFSSDYLACETAKARAIRSLPVHVMRKGDHGPENVPGHPLDAALHRPNALMAWGDLAAWAVIRRDTLGDAFIKLYRDLRGDVREMRPVLAPVDVRFDRDLGVAVYSAPEDRYNRAWTCREDDVIHIKTDVSENGGVSGKSIASLAAEDIGLSVDLTAFYRSLLENGNHFAGYLETDGKLNKEDVDAIRESLDETRGPENAGKIRIFDRGLKYREVSVRLEGMDIVAQERWVLEKVCRACHVDMHHVFADGQGAAATTATGADLDFVKNTVLPEVTAFEQALQPVLDRAASLGGKDSGLYVKFNLDGLLRGDMRSRMEAYRIAVYAGLRPAKDICETEDWRWYEGQQELLQPTAYYRVGADGKPYVPAQLTSPGQDGQSDGVSGIDEKAVGNALAPLLADAADRVRRRIGSDGDTPKTRAFAHQVLDPIALAAGQLGLFMDVDKAIEEEFEKCLNGSE